VKESSRVFRRVSSPRRVSIYLLNTLISCDIFCNNRWTTFYPSHMGARMPKIEVNSLQWSRLDNINNVRPIDEGDTACLNEIRDVLAKHDCLRRFGVSLLHSHFDLADDEMLLETTNVAKREHWVRPVKKAAMAEMGLEAQTTVLCFDDLGYSQNCGCLRDKDGHTGDHDPPVARRAD
jgi:hypothetical protein